MIGAGPARVRRTAARAPRVEDRMFNLIRIILSVIIPPLGVFLKVGLGGQFWLNILLTILGYIPGLVHAIWIIAREP
jgi:uncharacterized membrane protein YqaE (UPF0057 family)